MNSKLTRKKGFTLIELLVVIAIIGMLSSVILASLNTAREKARDARRLSDMKQIQTALEFYYDKFGVYPNPVSTAGCSGWEASSSGTFITPLVSNDFLPTHISDPSLDTSTCVNYKYYRYGPGGGTANCDTSHGGFFVLGVVDMETSSRPYSTSPGWSCPGRDWQNEFDWVTGGFEN